MDYIDRIAEERIEYLEKVLECYEHGTLYELGLKKEDVDLRLTENLKAAWEHLRRSPDKFLELALNPTEESIQVDVWDSERELMIGRSISADDFHHDIMQVFGEDDELEDTLFSQLFT